VAVFLLKMVIAFKTFDLVYVMTFGGPGAATNVATFEIWKTGLHEFDIGLAAAETLVLAVAVSVVTLPVVFLHNYADRKL
jgi:multiple sugar transport system permease protein